MTSQEDLQIQIQRKITQLQKLMDLDAKNTKAPYSMSVFINATISFEGINLQQAQFLLGQLDDWVHDMVIQTGYKGCVADLV